LLNGDIANMSIGQGDIQVTPLQLAQAMGIIANGGTFYQTRLVQQVQTFDNQVVTAYQVRAKRTLDLSSETLDELRTGMIHVVNGAAAQRTRPAWIMSRSPGKPARRNGGRRIKSGMAGGS